LIKDLLFKSVFYVVDLATCYQ